MSGKASFIDRSQKVQWSLAIAVIVALVALKVTLFRIPAQAEHYHEQIVAVAATVPTHFGSWVSVDAPVPEAAITMLRPNITVSRKYTNVETGEVATLLLVQCRDARDLFGHFPPVCYPAHGYRVVDSAPRDWEVDGIKIQGTEYNFSSNQPDELTSMIIYDVMLLPNGTTCRDMNGVYAAARDPRQRHFGAAQLQILLSPNLPVERRDQTFSELVHSNRATIDSILDGKKQS